MMSHKSTPSLFARERQEEIEEQGGESKWWKRRMLRASRMCSFTTLGETRSAKRAAKKREERESSGGMFSEDVSMAMNGKCWVVNDCVCVLKKRQAEEELNEREREGERGRREME